MRRIQGALAAAVGAVVCLATGRADARDLTLADRVRAQEAIERVYYAHQVGADQPFEQAVPRAALETKVRRQLKLSAALERIWKAPLTERMLDRELARINRDTRFPSRLQEIYRALNDDAFLVEETFIRGSLVERRARDLFEGDRRIHPTSETWEAWWDGVEGQFDERDAPVVARGDAALPEAAATDSSPACEGDDSWHNGVLDDFLEARQDHTAVWTGTEMIVWGGLPLFSNVNFYSGGRYDPLTDTWRRTSTLGAPEGRRLHAAVWTGKEMIVWGGAAARTDGLDHVLETGGRYDPFTDTWTAMSTSGAPVGRYSFSMVWAGSRLIVWGGYDGFAYMNSGGRYDPVTDTWSGVALTGAPAPREDHTAVWTGTEMLIWGGRSSDLMTITYLSDGGRYNPTTNTWSAVTPSGAPTGRALHGAVWTGSRMIIWGGFNNAPPTRTGGIFNPADGTWQPMSLLHAPAPRWYHGTVWANGRMIVWGGENDVEWEPNGAAFDPVHNAWRGISSGNAPEARINNSTLWADDRMIVWGGVAESGISNSGGQYDPGTDSWTPTAIPAGPGARSRHTAVWTGSHAIVWGGGDSTGARYDPLLDSWSQTSLTGAPPGRIDHSVIWTGTEMIVWGGYGSGYLKTGGRYNPLTDAWTPTSLSNAPSNRSQHSAIWTGSQMIVWGGNSNSGPRSDGFRYTPATDSWTSIAFLGSPERRGEHTAIWTGSEMIVWGGRDGGLDLDSGGRYSVVGDTWSATSTHSAPSARHAHTAIWIGDRMAVWGGGSGSSDFGDGALYNPATNKWTATSSSGAPSARQSHTVIWTGTEMVVWGGFGGGAYLGDGARYRPATNSWRTMSGVGAPGVRTAHTAVWTGGEMIVWGGTHYTGVWNEIYNDGGRYSIGPADADADGVADSCDCAPGDAGVFAAPGEITVLKVHPDATTISWTSGRPASGEATSHDVLRGLVSGLPVGAGGATCLAPDTDRNSVSDAASLPAGQAAWYLARAANVCGTGTYGRASDGTERISTACP